MKTTDNRDSELSKWIINNNFTQPNKKSMETNPFHFNHPTHNILNGGMIYIPQDKYYHFLSKYSDCVSDSSNSFYFSENANPNAFRYFIDIDYKMKIPEEVSIKTIDEIAQWSNQNLNQFVVKYVKTIRNHCHDAIQSFYIKKNKKGEFISDGTMSFKQHQKSVIPKTLSCENIKDMIICFSTYTSTRIYCKCGIHIYFPNVIVNNIRAIHLTNRIIQTLEQDVKLPFEMKWDEVIDWEIYKHPKLRMLYSNKSVNTDPVYSPKLFIDGKENKINDEKTKKMNQMKFESLIYTSLLYNAKKDRFFDEMTEPYQSEQEQEFKMVNDRMIYMVNNLIQNNSKSFCLDQKDEKHGKNKADWLYKNSKTPGNKQKEIQIKEENQLRVIFYLVLLYGKKMSINGSMKHLIKKKSPYAIHTKTKEPTIKSLTFKNATTGLETTHEINFESTYGDCVLNNCFYNKQKQTISASIYCKDGKSDRFCYNKGEIHMNAHIYFVFYKNKKKYKQDCYSSHCKSSNCIFKPIPQNCFDILFPEI